MTVQPTTISRAPPTRPGTCHRAAAEAKARAHPTSKSTYQAGICAPQHLARPPVRTKPHKGTFSQGRNCRPQAQCDLPLSDSRRGMRSTRTPPNEANTAPKRKPERAQYHSGRSTPQHRSATDQVRPAMDLPLTRRRRPRIGILSRLRRYRATDTASRSSKDPSNPSVRPSMFSQWGPEDPRFSARRSHTCWRGS